MAKMTRRDSLALLALSPLAGWSLGRELLEPAAVSAASAATLAGQAQEGAPLPRREWKQVSPREAIRQRYFPNIVLTTQENKKVRLYDDLFKDKVVLINFMYASCENLCPRVTQNLAKVQRLLGGRAGKEIFIYSFTLDPKNDTPAALKEYATLHHVGPGWSFLTGTPDEMEMLRRRLGFTDPDPALDKDKESHIGNVRYGNEARMLWGACPGLSHAEFIVESLSWVGWPNGHKEAA